MEAPGPRGSHRPLLHPPWTFGSGPGDGRSKRNPFYVALGPTPEPVPGGGLDPGKRELEPTWGVSIEYSLDRWHSNPT